MIWKVWYSVRFQCYAMVFVVKDKHSATVISNSLCERKKLYCAFIGFRKAIDYIDRSLLWIKLSKIDIQEKLWKVIKLLYNHVKSCIGVGRLSDYSLNNIGLMQGEVLSPILFNLYVNDFVAEVLNSGCTPYEMSSLNLYLLMYANDMVLSLNLL